MNGKCVLSMSISFYLSILNEQPCCIQDSLNSESDNIK